MPPAAITAAVQRYAAELADAGKIGSEFVAHASTWLNRQDFDGADRPDPPGGKPPVSGDYFDRMPEPDVIRHVRTWKATVGQWPLAQYTPPPDDPRTRVPTHILALFGIPYDSSRRSEPASMTGTG